MANIFDTDEATIQRLIEERKIKKGDSVGICGYINKMRVSDVAGDSLILNNSNRTIVYEVKKGNLNIFLI